MPFELRVYNPSDYWRTGHVTVEWEPIRKKTGIDPRSLVLRDQSGNFLPHQIDPIDPDRQELAGLSFTLATPLPPGRDDYDAHHPADRLILESGDPSMQRAAGPDVVLGREGPGGRFEGLKLLNDRIAVWINLVPAPWGNGRNWFAGSATTVELGKKDERKEVLDAHTWLFHDPEKRAMQLDRLRLSCPAWDPTTCQEFTLFDRPYSLVHHCRGPVRATVTLASDPFDYLFTDLRSKAPSKLVCRLFRVLSLYAGADYVVEELYVRGGPDGRGSREAVDLSFTAHYFSYLRMRGGLRISRFEHIPDWFAVTSGKLAVEQKFHGYGFATDVHASPVASPSPGFPTSEGSENTFSWESFPCRRAKCLHLFMFAFPGEWPEGRDFWEVEQEKARIAQRECESRTGRAWYEVIYKPLIARI